ncbi:MAG: hypothetical protein ACJATT_005523 [Myxococcota bacterium]|jgi:hypothetical protein
MSARLSNVNTLWSGTLANSTTHLQAATKELGVEVLLSAHVVKRAADEGCSLVLQATTDIEVRGRSGKHRPFSVPA